MSAAEPPKPRRNPTGQTVGPSIYKVPTGDDREIAGRREFAVRSNPLSEWGDLVRS